MLRQSVSHTRKWPTKCNGLLEFDVLLCSTACFLKADHIHVITFVYMCMCIYMIAMYFVQLVYINNVNSTDSL